jgi:exopolysaccharide biosynthesis polyprenyl glycosylphosphotransferase
MALAEIPRHKPLPVTPPVATATVRTLKRDRPALLGSLSTLAAFGDVLVILAGLAAAFWIRFESGWITFGVQSSNPPEFHQYFGLFGVGTTFLMGLLTYNDLYHPAHILRYRRTALIIVRSLLLWFVLYLGVSLTLKFDPPISRIYAASSALACGIALLGWRGLFQMAVQSRAIAPHLRLRVVFVGWDAQSTQLCQSILQDPSHPYEIVGCVPSAQGRFTRRPPDDIQMLGDYNHLPDLLQDQAVDMVIAADLDPSTNEMVSLANLCERHFIPFKVIPSYFQILVSGLALETISGVPVLGVSRLPLDRLSNRMLKRAVDIVGGVVGLMLSAPLIAVFGAIVYFESPGPIFYRQVRMGRNGKLFKIIKIRSMRLDAESDSGARWAVKDDPRRLRIGAFLREWNIDEIPQFWNVLKGEMSLVGPRPERPELIVGFTDQIPHYNARHGSKPGITGWAQIHGLRGDTDLTERVRYDIYYLENWSLLLDFHIMLMTFFRRDNAY